MYLCIACISRVQGVQDKASLLQKCIYRLLWEAKWVLGLVFNTPRQKLVLLLLVHLSNPLNVHFEGADCVYRWFFFCEKRCNVASHWNHVDARGMTYQMILHSCGHTDIHQSWFLVSNLKVNTTKMCNIGKNEKYGKLDHSSSGILRISIHFTACCSGRFPPFAGFLRLDGAL